MGNQLYWVPDVTFREDNSRVRRNHAPANLATLQNHLQAPMLAHWPFDPAAQADQLVISLP